ncbi:hypothetical protein SLEP1_g59731 [Rubroshorea leprosula]|uniref:Uncharacterized protein n=1 Tax=Rubroshorea leprosula TaxID=152421 RepID=A0AAV5L662_9ROSI|nr:hypothetical protein SLEP1_g41022 [Rubroshorea leprosula]GKV53194.1 hypothetical protein SLEP1_g59731 [Rubroshorea leprosula]
MKSRTGAIEAGSIGSRQRCSSREDAVIREISIVIQLKQICRQIYASYGSRVGDDRMNWTQIEGPNALLQIFVKG